MSRCVARLVVAVSVVLAGHCAWAQPEEGEYYQIKSVSSGKALALDDKAQDGAQIIQRGEGQGERAHWTFEKVGKFYRITNRKSGQKLNVRSKDEGEPIIASEKANNSQWSLEKKGDRYVIRSRHSDMVIDVANDSKDRKAPIIQYPYHEGRNQLFELQKVEK